MDKAEIPYRDRETMSTHQPAAHAIDSMHTTASTGHQYAAVNFSGNSTGHVGDVVHHHHHYPNAEQGQRTTLLHSSCRIPFRRDRDFVERPPFHEIYECATQPAARVGVIGLGGTGKTQLAIEYAYRRRSAEPQTWVFWVHASSVARFEQSYRQIAEQVSLSGWADPKADVLSMVYAWLCDENNGSWTMVVDNADDSDVIFGTGDTEAGVTESSSTSPSNALFNRRSIVNCLPSSAHGSVLITSRSREVVEGLIEYAEDIFEVKPMCEEDALALLKKKLKKSQLDVDQTALSRLVNQLDYMPLAITQAAAYINQPGPRMTVSRYSEQLTRSNLNRDRLLAKGLRDPRRDGEASNSIITTWHASFERIRQTRSSAARLLSLMSLFDREGIPKRLLQGQYLPGGNNEVSPEQESTHGTEVNDMDLEDDLNVLYVYDLVNADVNGDLFEMHRLVQYSTRKWLELNEEATHWQERYIDILETAFPATEFIHWPTCHALFPHVEQILSYGAENENYIKKRAAIMHRGGRYAWDVGQFQIAKQMVEISVIDRENVLGKRSCLTLNSLSVLGCILRSQGKYDEAEVVTRRALVGYEKELGMNHPTTLSSACNLAIMLELQGAYTEAEKMGHRALVGSEKELGMDHPLTISAMSALASVLQQQGKYDEAEELSRRAVVGHEKELGANHLTTLTGLINLSMILRSQGKYSEAEEMCRRAMVGQEKQLGASHPTTLNSVSSLATVLLYQSKHEEAEAMSRRALAGREKQLGASHPETLINLNNLAMILKGQGKYRDAEQMCRRALVGMENGLGENHPDTMTFVFCLADIRHAQRAFAESLQLCDRAIKGYVESLGPSHPTTRNCQDYRELLLQDME